MRHSYRWLVAWALFAVELALFIGAAISGYLSQNTRWQEYWLVTAVAALLYGTVRFVQARPSILDAAAFEDSAAQMARSARLYGVERFYNMQLAANQDKRNQDTIAAINTAEAMWLCANSGASYLDPAVYRHWTSVEARLAQGVPFKVVLLDPLSAEKRFRNQLNVGGEADDSKINLAILIRLYNQFPSLEIRFIGRGMTATVFATPTRLFYDPYHAGVVGQRIENRSYCLNVVRATPARGVGYFDLFRAHFDSLWQNSQDLEDWYDANARVLKALPNLQRRHQPRPA